MPTPPADVRKLRPGISLIQDKTLQPNSNDAPVVPKLTAQQHVGFLDGMRGAAALWVLIFHLTTVLPRQDLAPWLQRATEPFTEGHICVGIFIVLSGYLLMLGPARSDTFEMRGGLKTYFVRRARRILPPYYAALFFSLPTEIYRQHIHAEPFSWGAFLSHLFLVHNMNADWVAAINAPMWSVAVEFQIYIIFALVLLPMSRRFGGFGASVAVAWILSLVPFFLLPRGHNFVWSAPWYLGLFAFGMTGAMITQRGDTLPWTKAANRFPWMLIVIPCFVVSASPTWHKPLDSILRDPYLLRDVLIGIAAMGTIVTGVQSLQRGATRGAGYWITRLLGSPLMTGLGAFSYSIYLTHFPLLSVLDTIFKRFNANPMALAAFQLCIVFPVCLLFAFVFYRVFEKPFTLPREAAREPFTPPLIPATEKIV